MSFAEAWADGDRSSTPDGSQTPVSADHDTRGRSVVLATCCLAVYIAGIDTTIVNVALPSLQRALHASVSDLQWTIDVYTLVIACFFAVVGLAG